MKSLTLRPSIRPDASLRRLQRSLRNVVLNTALQVAGGIALGTVVGGTVLIATESPALAQNKAVEGAARGLQKKAMQEDYLSTEFDKAQEKLSQAIAKCGADKCSLQVRSELRRDLGVVLIGGQIDKEKGIASFVDALKLDPALQLDPDVKTKELEKIWDDARKQAAGGPAPKPAATVEAPSGDFAHTPVAEQTLRTPVPVYAEYTGPEQVVRVVAKYKGFGMPDWKTVELRKVDKGYGGLLPCADVMQGEILYYLQGFNAQSDPVATSGDRNNPFRVPVKAKIDGEAPHLPGQAAPKPCNEPGASDCPPDFPGCKKATPAPVSSDTTEDDVRKSEGEDCDEDSECKSTQCKKGKCGGSGESKFPRFWVGVAGELDFVFLGSGTEVCKLFNSKQPKSDYYCTDGDADYPSRATRTQNDAITTDLNKVSGGGALGPIRVMVALDFALNPNFLLGARLGYAFNTYPGKAAGDDGRAFPPIHLEARGTYLIGKDAITKQIAPYGLIGLGVSQFDAKIDVNVVEKDIDPSTQAPIDGTGKKRTVQAWGMSGPFFATIGGGVRFAAGKRVAITVAPLKFSFAVGANGALPVYSPELGIQGGF